MSKNVIFYFSGTGNCLYAAKETAKALSDCEIVSMSSNNEYIFSDDYERIGFIYPTYFLGIPLKVKEFVSRLKLPEDSNIYYFAIGTNGGTPGNVLSMLNDILLRRNLKLNYGVKLKMFSNYVVLYDMSVNVDKIDKKSHEELIPIINDIKDKKTNKIKGKNMLSDWYYNNKAKKIPEMDKDFNVSDNCNSCGTCQDICPVSNIRLINNKPSFLHHCEQCVACIQNCPKRAINYKNKTQKRRRYKNPNISLKELSQKVTN